MITTELSTNQGIQPTADPLNIMSILYAIRNILGRSVRNMTDCYFAFEQAAQKNIDQSVDKQVANLRSVLYMIPRIAMIATPIIASISGADIASTFQFSQTFLTPVEHIISSIQNAAQTQYGAEVQRNQGSLEKLSSNKHDFIRRAEEINKLLFDAIDSTFKLRQSAASA